MKTVNFTTLLRKHGCNTSKAETICVTEGIKIQSRVRSTRGYSTYVSEKDAKEYIESLLAYRAARAKKRKESAFNPLVEASLNERVSQLQVEMIKLQRTVREIVEMNAGDGK